MEEIKNMQSVYEEPKLETTSGDGRDDEGEIIIF